MAKPIFTQMIERARAYVAVRSSWTRYTLALTAQQQGLRADRREGRALLRLSGRWCVPPTT